VERRESGFAGRTVVGGRLLRHRAARVRVPRRLECLARQHNLTWRYRTPAAATSTSTPFGAGCAGSVGVTIGQQAFPMDRAISAVGLAASNGLRVVPGMR